MKKIINTLLFFIFVVIFAIFVYRSSFSPQVIRTSANSTAIEKAIDKNNDNLISKEEIGEADPIVLLFLI